MDRSLMRYMTPHERQRYEHFAGPLPQPAQPGVADWRQYMRGGVPGIHRATVTRYIPYLMKRDHGRCQIADCSFADRRIRAKTGMGRPSADHIIPWSLWRPEDGLTPDCLENLQLAHLRCNFRKGNRQAGQMLLFG